MNEVCPKCGKDAMYDNHLACMDCGWSSFAELQQQVEAKDKRIAELLGHLETAWGVIANAGHPSLGDWDGMPEGWKEAAEKWRDDYHAILAKKGAGK